MTFTDSAKLIQPFAPSFLKSSSNEWKMLSGRLLPA
jgi:hypothetical protein